MRLRLQRDETRATQLLNHRGEVGRIVDDARIRELRRARSGRRRQCGARFRSLACRHRGEIGELRDQGTEFELREQRSEGVAIGRADAQLFEIELHGHVTPQRHELARETCIVGLLQERLAGALARDVRRAGENRVQISVGLEQLHRGLVANALDAGNIVGAVADEGEIIHHPLRRHAEPLACVRLIDPLLLDGRLSTAPGVEQRDPLTDQLIKILVP